MPDWIYEDSRLSFLEAKILAFIYTYKGDKFYFSNEQLGEQFSTHPKSVSRAIAKLKKYKFIDTKSEIKAGGGEVRFIIKRHADFVTRESTKLLPKDQPNGYSSYIKGNKIKENTPYNPPSGDLPLNTFLEEFNTLFSKKYRPTPALGKKLKLRLKTYTLEEILKAVRNLARSDFHHGKNERGWEAKPEFLIRSDEKIDEWLNTQAKRSKSGFEISESMGYVKAGGDG